MQNIFRINLFLWFSLAAIYIASWYLQSQVLISWDVSWGLHEAARLLDGGTYGKEFFEFSPPMFLYLYAPSVLLSKYFHIENVLAIKVYVFVLSSLSLYVCYVLCQKIFSEKDKDVFALFILALASVFLLLPLPFDFGQREHLMVILIMPYLLLISCRLQGYQSPKAFSILIGVVAGLGFVIKPYFFITFVLCELYFMMSRRNFFSCLRVETISIACVSLVYLGIIFLCYHYYLSTIIPLAMRIYYQGYGSSLQDLLNRGEAVFCGFAVLLYLSQYVSNPYKTLSALLLFALLGFYIGYLLQQTVWFYHLFPAYSFAMLSIVLSLSVFVLQKNTLRMTYGLMSVILVFSIGFLLRYAADLWTFLILQRTYFFIFIGVTFFIMFYLCQFKKSIMRVVFCLLITLSLSYLFAYQMNQTSWYPHVFSATLIILVLLFALFVSKEKISKAHAIFSALCVMIIFSYPFYSASHRYWSALNYKLLVSDLISYMQKNAKDKPVYFFSTMMSYEFPAVDYAKAMPASKFPLLLWLPGMLKQIQSGVDSKRLQQLEQDHNYFVESIAEELNEKKPLFVFVDVKKNKPYLSGVDFDYVESFSKNKSFKEAWRAYHYVDTITQGSAYKLKIYQR